MKLWLAITLILLAFTGGFFLGNWCVPWAKKPPDDGSDEE